VAAVSTLLAVGIILDAVFQLVIYKAVHPGAALVIGPILICVPYALSRVLTTRLARRLGVHHRPVPDRGRHGRHSRGQGDRET
jgi:hypothetical protein